MGEGPVYLSIPQAAERLAVSKRFVERLIATDELPVHRFGRTVRIKCTDLDELAQQAAVRVVGGRSKKPGASRG